MTGALSDRRQGRRLRRCPRSLRSRRGRLRWQSAKLWTQSRRFGTRSLRYHNDRGIPLYLVRRHATVVGTLQVAVTWQPEDWIWLVLQLGATAHFSITVLSNSLFVRAGEPLFFSVASTRGSLKHSV